MSRPAVLPKPAPLSPLSLPTMSGESLHEAGNRTDGPRARLEDLDPVENQQLVWAATTGTQLWAEQGPCVQLVRILSVWFLSSRDNPFYLARQLNCFHFF